MNNRIAQLLGVSTLLACSLPAVAATVEVRPASLTVPEGGVIAIEIFMDAADAVTPSPDAIKGMVLIEYDAGLAVYNGDFAISSPATLKAGPTPGTGTLTFDFENAQATGVIATFSLTATGGAGSIINISVDDNALLGSSFIDIKPTNKPFFPVFVPAGVEITAIPVPAAGWLLISGLGLLGITMRRARG